MGRYLIALAVMVLAIGGCGSDDSEDGPEASSAADEEAVTEVTDAFFTDGLTNGDESACALLTPEAEEAFSQVYDTKNGTCEQGIDLFANQGNPSQTLYDIESVVVEGDTATVTFTFNEATLERSGEEWLISDTGLSD